MALEEHELVCQRFGQWFVWEGHVGAANSKAGDTQSSRHVSSCDVTIAVGIFNIEFWRTLTLLSLCLRHVIWRGALAGSRASTPPKFLLAHTFHDTWRTCIFHWTKVTRIHDGQYMYKVTRKGVLVTNCCSGKAISITYSASLCIA
jgi:hypothetical protein